MTRYPLRRQVEECNNARLNALPGVSTHYHAMDFAGYDMYETPLTIPSAEKLLERLVALRVISLKARPMFLCNPPPHHLIWQVPNRLEPS